MQKIENQVDAILNSPICTHSFFTRYLSRYPFLLLIAALLFFLSSCRGSSSNVWSLESTGNEYAMLFSIREDGSGNRYLTVNETWDGSSNPKEYKLVDRAKHKDGVFAENEIPVPIQNIACMSTSHIAYMAALGKEELISAVSGAQYVSTPSVAERITKGEIKDIGYEGALNYELLIMTRPEILITYGIRGQDNQHLKKMKELGIKHLVIGDYLENHPLGKLEYLKLFGALLGCSQSADSIYRATADRYLTIKENISDNVTERVKVLINAPWKDIWYIPGNENYMSVMVQDAGGDLIGSREDEYISFPYGLEEIILKAYDADYWLNPNSHTTMHDLAAQNMLFSKLPLFKPGKIFNNTKQNTPNGGSNFWEKGVVEPDIILKDLATILHPEIYSHLSSAKEELQYYIELK